MPINLTTRQVRTVEWLLTHDGSQSIGTMAEQLRLTPRMVRSDLDGVERFVNRFDVALQRRRGVGVWLEGAPGAIDSIRESLAALEDGDAIRVMSPSDRRNLALFELLAAAPDTLTVEQMCGRLEVSVTSARRDIAGAEEWLAARGLFLARQPGVGMTVVGTETAIRRSLVKLLLETVPPAALARQAGNTEWWRVSGIAAGIRDFLRSLPLADCHEIVHANDGLRSQAESGHPWLAVDLAVTMFRIREGRLLDLEPGTQRSLRDHPVWETAESIAPALAVVAKAELPEAEIGGITEHLLGAAELASGGEARDVPHDALVQEAVTMAANELHPGLEEDKELIRSLADHVERLQVRLRYGLPVHNPLLREVSSRYPDVHSTATDIARLIGEQLGSPVSADEAGFVTMYLSGALERLRLRPRTRAIIMCPAGTATAWILVSRIQAEFPELDLVDVVSAGLEAGSLSDVDADLIISTVDIGSEHHGLPVVVVGALLPENDVRRVSRFL